MKTALLPLAARVLCAATFLCLGGSSAIQATPSPGPDPGGYSSVAIAGNLRDIRATGSPVVLTDDQVAGPVPLPFPFQFYGVTQTEVFISSNGFIAFQPVTPGCCEGKRLPTADTIDNLIAGYWDNLNNPPPPPEEPEVPPVDPPPPGRILYATRGVAPARTFVVGYYAVGHYPATPVTFEIILHEGSGAIELQYGSVTSDGDGMPQTAGIENAYGTIGLEVAHGDVSFSDTGVLITHHAPTASITMADGDACPVRVEMAIADDRGHTLAGEVNAYSALNAYPDGLSEIRLEMLHVGCGSQPPQTTLSLGSTMIATFGDRPPPCACDSGVETRTYADPAVLAAWARGGADNVFRLTRREPEPGAVLVWARVVLNGPAQPERSYCLSGNCDAKSICDPVARFRLGDFRLETRVEPSLTPVSSTTYADSTLPPAASLAGMTRTGLLELIADDGQVSTATRFPFERPEACSLAAINIFNTAPTAACHDVVVPADPVSCTAPASIDNGSSDADGPVTLAQSPAGPFGLGFTPVSLTATDAGGLSSSCQATVEVVDRTAPAVAAAAATPSILWPPNHSMVPVRIGVSLQDACDPGARCAIASVRSSEPSVNPDWEITGPLTVNLRAEREGAGHGRVYTINLRCADASGNETLRTVLVTAPHDSSKE